MAPSAAINEAAGRRKARQRFGRKEFAIPANPWRSRGVIDGGRDPTRPGGGYYLEPASEGLANTCVSVHVPDVEAVMRKLLGDHRGCIADRPSPRPWPVRLGI